MKAVIIDDEPAIGNTISSILKKNFNDIIVLATAGSVEEGLSAIMLHKPEIVFLDVELPDGTGFDILKQLSSVTFRIIFITGHREYALDAIKVSALDYILKPIDNDELIAAINKARELIDHEEEQLKLSALKENMRERKVFKRIILRTSDALQLISVADIIRAEAESNYTHFYLTGGKHIMVSRTIKEYDAMLSGSGLIRVHQSHLVNIDFIDKFLKRDGGHLKLKDGSVVQVSPNLKQKVLKAINDHLYD